MQNAQVCIAACAVLHNLGRNDNLFGVPGPRQIGPQEGNERAEEELRGTAIRNAFINRYFN